MKAIWNSQVIAESDDTLVVEGNHYFPRSSLDDRFFSPSEHTSSCYWKGTAEYLSVEVDGQRNHDSAWFYPDPKAKAADLKDRVAFWKGIVVSD